MVDEYTEKIDKINDEAEVILSEARRRAKLGEAQVMAQAKGEAELMIKRAEGEIELEKRRALEDVKQEMIDIASVMASKAVSGQMNADIQDKMVEETIKEMDGSTWQTK